MSMFWGFARRPKEPESWTWQLLLRPRENSLSNSQRDFVLIPWILALWHQAMRAITVYRWPKTCAKWPAIRTTIMCTAWSLTVGGVSNPWPLAEPSCTGIDPETGTEIAGPGDSVHASVANAVVGAWSTPATETLLSGEILKSTRLFQWK